MRLGSSVTRYAAASIAALAIDFVLTMALFNFTDLSLTLSAGIAFVLVGVVFYFVHEYWSFRRPDSAFSPRRLLRNFGILCAAFFARISVIGLLETWQTPGFILSIIYFGMGVSVSFAINYLANRYWVFANTES
ncbi:MAG: GtrA family protein [Pseudomonadota bacterium]